MVTSNKNLPVMLVDDDPLIRESLTMFLEDLEFPVLSCSCSREALQMAHENRPAVCLIDLRLNGECGESLIAAIRQLSPATRCLIYSGSNYTISDTLVALGMTQDDVLRKPIADFELLINKITG